MNKIYIIVIIILIIVGGFAFLKMQKNDGGRACTMEAKVCPDGTAVGRTGPNCEFAPCQ